MIKPQLDQKFAEGVANAKKLLDPQQLARLQELQWRRDGISSIATPEVREKLGVTEKQRGEIERTVAKARKEMQKTVEGANTRSGEGRAAAFQKLAKLRSELDGELLKILTPSQRENWEQLLGKRFDFGEKRATDTC
jgi:hypothetical protein